MKIKLIVTALLLGGHLYANAQTSVSDTIRSQHTFRLTALDSLIDFLNRPAIMRLIQETVTIETVIKPVFNFKAKE